MANKKLYKSVSDKKLTGVCGGLAKYLGIDAAIVRILWFVITWFHGFGLILYIAAALILSDDPDEIVAQYENTNSKPNVDNVVDVEPGDVEIIDEEDRTK